MKIYGYSYVWLVGASVHAFSPVVWRTNGRSVSYPQQSQGTVTSTSITNTNTIFSTSLFAGGFGGSSGSGSKGKKNSKKSSAGNNNNKQAKLKPKQQWDRYLDLKKETKFPVGVKSKDDSTDEWTKVGNIRSKDSEFTEVSVALQRALIAEHAKRLFPVQMKSKKALEWGYLNEEQWTVVDKSILEGQSLPDGIEKQIGFEGTPDPSTGFYCIYDGGKLKLGEESSFA